MAKESQSFVCKNCGDIKLIFQKRKEEQDSYKAL